MHRIPYAGMKKEKSIAAKDCLDFGQWFNFLYYKISSNINIQYSILLNHCVLNITLTFIAANSFTRYLTTNGISTFVHLLVLQAIQMGSVGVSCLYKLQ
jgi:hypothetical protein